MQKPLLIISMAIVATLIATPAISKPLTYKSSKGTYTIDFTRGTYRGCISSGGCISLGRKQIVPCKVCESTEWKNGEFKYSVQVIDETASVVVTRNDRKIFEDEAKIKSPPTSIPPNGF
jgi:hypothetical protein